MALILEYLGKNREALEMWQQLKTEEGCHKTVSILRKKTITDRELILKYSEWVLVKNPEIGLKLFVERNHGQKKEASGAGSS